MSTQACPQKLFVLTLLSFILASILLFSQPLLAETATSVEMDLAAQNWLNYYVYENGGWAEALNPQIVKSDEIVIDGRSLGRLYTIEPSGFILVPILKELPSVLAYDEKTRLDINDQGGMLQFLRDILKSRADGFVAQYGSLEAIQDNQEANPHRAEWDRFTVSTDKLPLDRGQGSFAPMSQGEILLYPNEWHQGSPYNNLCPIGDGGRTVVGCVATAATQIMWYYQWPPAGVGNHTYWWNGDNGENAQYLSADFSDEYDWANMPPDCDGGCTTAEKAALAELSYEVGVAHNMDYGVEGSGTWPDRDVWIDYFRYDESMSEAYRGSYSAQGWFDLIVSEVEAGRPMAYTIPTHALVCDGWRINGAYNQMHMNYGWGGLQNAWYVVDNLYYPGGPGGEYFFYNIMPVQDADEDGYLNDEDNCPVIYNPGQEDDDGDDVGNLCDNCLNGYNPDQSDVDLDGMGDVCDPDADADGIPNTSDNCPLLGNVGQDDNDEDDVGNACDNCPDTPNPDQGDANDDGIGDACDGQVHLTGDEPPNGNYSYPYFYQLEGVGGVPPYHYSLVFGAQIPYGCVFNGDTLGTITGTPNWASTYVFKVQLLDSQEPPLADTGVYVITISTPDSICFDQDQDGWGDPGYSNNDCPLDNCPTAFNPDQDDDDGDGVGNTCDPCPLDMGADPDGDEVCTSIDNCPETYNPEQIDSDGDGTGDACEIVRVCGDANNDQARNVSDAVYVLNYVFIGGSAPDPLWTGDANCDELVNVSDAVWIINFVFTGGYQPCDTNGDSQPDCH